MIVPFLLIILHAYYIKNAIKCKNVSFLMDSVHTIFICTNTFARDYFDALICVPICKYPSNH